MKYLRTIMVLLILCVPILAEDFIVTEAEYVLVTGNTSDTLGRGRITPDSIRIVVTDSNLTELFDAWFEPADAQCALNGNVISFSDQWEDINGAASVGIFSIHVEIASDGQGDVDVFGGREYTLRGVTVAVNTTFDEVSRIGDSVDAYDDWVAQNAFFDTLIYVGPRGLGIYLDSASGNTNTVLGVDGTASNPVSTLVAARTLSDALSVKRYYFLNASTFNDAAVDLAADHQNFEFIGVGHGSELAFGAQRVDNSRFDHLGLSGAMHASGGDVFYTYCTFGFITANFNGHADNSWLTDTIVVKAGKDIEFTHCHSGVAGNETPTIDFSGGSSGMSMRNYSGGIRILNGSSNDTISVETDGQLIIDASNTSLTVTARGMMTITDNGTTTSLTKDAVFSRQESGQWVPFDTNASGEIVAVMPDDWTAADSTAYQGAAASGIDSTTLSNILHRIVWGTAVGSGSDSSTIAQRDATVAAIVNDIITAAAIATNAIGALEIAADAIGSSEIAADAIGSSEIAASAIGADEIATNAIGSTEIATDAIGSAEIASQAIGSAELAPDAIGASELATDATQEISDMVWDQISQGAVVEDSTGNNTTRVQTNLAESTDDQYNGQLVLFMDGTEAGEARLITDYNGTNGYLVFTPALTATPGTGDSLRILPWGYIQDVVTGAGSISDADMIAIVDTLMKRIVSDDTTAGAGFDKAFADFLWRSGDTTNWLSLAILLDSIYHAPTSDTGSGSFYGELLRTAGTGGGSDSATVYSAVLEGLQDVGFASADSSLTMGGSGLSITATGNNNAMTLAGGGTGAGLKTTGGATGHGLSALGGGTSGDGIRAYGQTSGHGLIVIASDANKYGFYASSGASDGGRFEGAGSGDGASFHGGASGGDGVYLNGDNTGLDLRGEIVINDTLPDGEQIAINESFDTLKYGGGVWVDDGANTNTVVGTDGIPTNPVGTIAAAKTIADALGLKRIYFIEGTNETIGATMKHYEFIGVGAVSDVTITMGGQDVDGSVFENVILTGLQGGTGLISARHACLSNADSLEIQAYQCAFLGNLSLRVGTSYFIQCWSSVAGAGTHTMDFNGAAGAINVSIRSYSGGLELLNMTSNHTISYESDGQLIINANCTSANVTARGMMTITDNGTTTSLTKDAVFSRAEADLWVWANVDTAGSVDTSDVGDWLKNNIAGGLVTPTDTTESGYAVSSQGFGPDTLVLYFNDTSGTDTPIGDVFFSIQNSVGTPIMAFSSETATGKRTIHLEDGSYTVVPRKTGYIYESYALTASGNNDSVEVAGYNVVIGSSGAPNVCRVYGYVTDVGGTAVEFVTVTASLPNDTYDSCSNTIVFQRLKDVDTRGNTGYFFLDLTYSSCLSSEQYDFTFEKKDIPTITRKITVPDSAQHYITWDDD